MSQRNKNNSIVFLTTLSVYLGLVLVGGATPQVLAQIENSQRTIQSSVKPTNSEIKRFIEYKYAEKLKEFAEGTFVRIEIVKLQSPEEILDERFYAKATTFAPYIDEDGELLEAGYIDSDNNVQWMLAAQAGIMANVGLELLDHFSDLSKQNVKKSVFQNSIQIILDNSEYKSELVINKSSNQRAESLASWLKEANEYLILNSKDAFAKRVYENTQITSINNQVFIVTRLPRGSLDELLKQDAKAENK